MSPSPEFPTPTTEESDLALESSRRLAPLVAEAREAVRVRVEAGDDHSEVITLPAAALRVLQIYLTETARGNAVMLIASHAELSTQDAADILNVSRPFLIGLLDERKIPSRKVGTHRRVRLDDLLRYKQSIERDRLQVLEELSAQAQELGMG